MGTNFYAKTNRCKTCGHKPEDIHLGKSSAGWQFTFQYNRGKYYKNVGEMKEWLKGKVIRNEYGQRISRLAFWRMVKDKQTPKNKNHAKEMHKQYPNSRKVDLIIEGYSFTNCEFS